MRLRVTRGAGDCLAPEELSAGLACSEGPATQAGRNYLDANGVDRLETTLTCIRSDAAGAAMPGDLAAVIDTTAGETWRGKIASFALALEVDDSGAATVSQTIVVERPL